MYLSKIKKVSIGICLALTTLPMTIFAAGLGQLNVASGIGEPLKADIQLLSVTASELASLNARIAPQAAYAAQGLERPSSHNGIRINVTKSPSGKNILKLQSNQPVTEPFLDMLVELEWETGRILREYTVLLDPPGYDSAVNTSQIQTPTIKTVNKEPVSAAAPIKSASPIRNTVQENATQQVKSDAETLTEDHLTRRGDTLSKIARNMKPEGVSLDQMLVGLYEANPEAFVGKNMNRLKVGKILQPPSKEALNAISRKEAVKEIKVQTANWNEYRNKLAGIVEDSMPVASEVDNQAASGKIKPSAEDKSIPEGVGPKDVVKLSSGDAKAEADMQAKITSLQEEVSAREKGLQEAQERTAALEKQIEDMQKLLTLKNDALSEPVQQPVQEVDPQDAAESELVKEVKEDVATSPVAETSETTKQTTDLTTQKLAKPETSPKPVEQPSLVASILNTITGMFGDMNTTLLAGGAGILALATGAWFYLRNKRRKNLADFEQGIMTSGGLKANTVFGNTSGTSVDTGDTSFLTDFSQSTSGGMIDTNDVDPIAEAEVYMAYGRDAQAEEILKDAISKEPKRYELHLKLLEMYAASKNMSAFETVSGELYTTLGAEDPTWAKVAEIGIKLEPNNPLYQAKGAVGVTTDAIENVDEKLDASDFSDSPLAAEADLDFSLSDDSQPEVKPQENEEQSSVVDISEDASDEVAVDETVLDIPNVTEVLETQDSALEFDLGDQEPLSDVTEVAAEEVNFTNTMPDLDFPSLEGDESTQGAEADSGAVQSKIEMSSDLTLDMPEIEAVEESNLTEATNEVLSDNLDFDANTLTADTVTLASADSEQDSSDSAPQENVLDMTDISLEVDEDDNNDEMPQENILDMSDISLEVNDDVNSAIAEATQEAEPELISTEPESEEVETKLELVAAYIDMEDKEGAKELLDEVLKEGGTNQRKRAEELMATLS